MENRADSKGSSLAATGSEGWNMLYTCRHDGRVILSENISK